jgi:hypothetical protein
MKIEKFILSILNTIESMKEGVVAYSYKTGNTPMTHVWCEISVSDFDLYMNDKRFKTLSNAWHKASKAKGHKIIFVCGWMPTEEKLVKLSDENNLILNI